MLRGALLTTILEPPGAPLTIIFPEKTQKQKSLAIQFSTCDGMKEKDAREIFTNKLVYVYHDVIDSTGDKKVSEKRTFKAVEDAIADLKRFVTNAATENRIPTPSLRDPVYD